MKRIRIAALGALCCMLSPLAALAHAKMTASTPKDGGTVAAGVSEIELTFSHPLRLTVVHVRAHDHHEVPLTSELPNSASKTIKLKVGALPPESYQVSWIAVSDDGHVMKGEFAFSVQAGTQPAK